MCARNLTVVLLAIISLAGCSKDEVVVDASPQPPSGLGLAPEQAQPDELSATSDTTKPPEAPPFPGERAAKKETAVAESTFSASLADHGPHKIVFTDKRDESYEVKVPVQEQKQIEELQPDGTTKEKTVTSTREEIIVKTRSVTVNRELISDEPPTWVKSSRNNRPGFELTVVIEGRPKTIWAETIVSIMPVEGNR